MSPVLSILRDFSAPVQVISSPPESMTGDEELIFLMAHDTDSFNKWDAGNRYYTRLILSLAEGSESIDQCVVPESFIEAIRIILQSAGNEKVDQSLTAYALQLPDLTTLLNQMKKIDIDRLVAARKAVKKAVAERLRAELMKVYEATAAKEGAVYEFSPQEVGRRRLHSTCLDFLSSIDSGRIAAKLAKKQFDCANCMTDKLSSLACLVSCSGKLGLELGCVQDKEEALSKFYTDAGSNALVVNKWFAIQAMADYDGVLDDVKRLKTHPDFTISNPNRARSLISTFCGNLAHFHSPDGQGYRFLTDSVLEIDRVNPQVAARMVSSFAQWKKFDVIRAELMRLELEKILAAESLSSDTFEVVNRCLKK